MLLILSRKFAAIFADIQYLLVNIDIVSAYTIKADFMKSHISFSMSQTTLSLRAWRKLVLVRLNLTLNTTFGSKTMATRISSCSLFLYLPQATIRFKEKK